MKKLILLIAILAFGMNVNAQKENKSASLFMKADKPSIKRAVEYTFQKEYKLQFFKSVYTDYLEYCNETILDTIQQYGEVTTKLVPVFDESGELLKYVYGNRSDTIWNDVNCKEYLRNDDYTFIGIDYSPFYVISDSYTTSNTYLSSYPIEESAAENKPDKFNYDIHRDYVCKVKREKPCQNGFYDWLFNLLSK